MFRSRIAWGLGFISCERGGREGRAWEGPLVAGLGSREEQEGGTGWVEERIDQVEHHGGGAHDLFLRLGIDSKKSGRR